MAVGFTLRLQLVGAELLVLTSYTACELLHKVTCHRMEVCEGLSRGHEAKFGVKRRQRPQCFPEHRPPILPPVNRTEHDKMLLI